MEQFMRQLEEVLVMMEKQVTSWGKQRTVILYKFQLCLLANKEGDKFIFKICYFQSWKMSDSSSCELVRINSNPVPVEWEACPATTQFKLKIRKASEKPTKMVYVYNLKEGTPLPYKPSISTAPGWLIMTKSVKLK